jgi:hypothetical protein
VRILDVHFNVGYYLDGGAGCLTWSPGHGAGTNFLPQWSPDHQQSDADQRISTFHYYGSARELHSLVTLCIAPLSAINTKSKLDSMRTSSNTSGTLVSSSSSLQITIKFASKPTLPESTSKDSSYVPPHLRDRCRNRERKRRLKASPEPEQFMIFHRDGLCEGERCALATYLQKTLGVSNLMQCPDQSHNIRTWSASLTPDARLKVSQHPCVLGMVLDGPEGS